MDYAVVHQPTNDFILNSAAFYTAQLHREWAQLPIKDVTRRDWTEAVQAGINTWAESIKQKDDSNEKKREAQRARLNRGRPSQQAAKRRRTHTSPPSGTYVPVAGPSS